VIPFPKTNQGTDQMTGAPVVVDAAQLAELHVKPTTDAEPRPAPKAAT